MISLKRNSKLQLVPALGKRSRQSSIYQPNQTEPFKISRGKFNDFLTCPKCFYMDRVKGLASPGMPGWTLNETTDRLLKKEFDICRKKKTPHRIFLENNLGYLVPFDHPDMDKWREGQKRIQKKYRQPPEKELTEKELYESTEWITLEKLDMIPIYTHDYIRNGSSYGTIHNSLMNTFNTLKQKELIKAGIKIS